MWCGSTEVDVCGGDAGATTGHHGDRDDDGVGQRLRATMRSVSALEGIVSSILFDLSLFFSPKAPRVVLDNVL
jgi:hypothetical protein